MKEAYNSLDKIFEQNCSNMSSCKNSPLETFERRDGDEIRQPMSRWASAPDLVRASHPEQMISPGHYFCGQYVPDLRVDPRRGQFLPLDSDKRKARVQRRLQDKLLRRMPPLPDLTGPGYFQIPKPPPELEMEWDSYGLDPYGLIQPDPELEWEEFSTPSVFQTQGGGCTFYPQFIDRQRYHDEVMELDSDIIVLKMMKLLYLPGDELPYVIIPNLMDNFAKRAMLQLRFDNRLTPEMWFMIKELCGLQHVENGDEKSRMASDILMRHAYFLRPDMLREEVLSLVYEAAGMVLDYNFLLVRRILGGAYYTCQVGRDGSTQVQLIHGILADPTEPPPKSWLTTCAEKIHKWIYPQGQGVPPETTTQAFCQKVYETLASTFSCLGMASSTIASKAKDFIMAMFKVLLGPIDKAIGKHVGPVVFTFKMIVLLIVAGLVAWLYCTASSQYLMGCALRSGVAIIQSGSDAVRIAVDDYADEVRQRKGLGKFQMQGGTEFSVLSAILIMVSTILGLTTADEKYLNGRLSTILKIVSTGTIITALGSQFLLLLPIAMREGIVRRFGSPQEAYALECNAFLVEARALIVLSKNVDVVLSKTYSERIQPLVNTCLDLMKRGKPGPMSNLLLSTSSQLMRIKQIISSFDHARPVRRTPYGLHIYSSPGVGKSLAVNRIMADVFGIRNPWTYAKGDDFWTGYGRQEGMIWDEFMVGDVNERQQNARTWLSVMSATDFRPNMASVDDPTIGIKGTPIYHLNTVITCNNNPIQEAPGYDEVAINRRHNYKVLLTIKPQWRQNWNEQTGKFKFDGMTQAQMRDLDWLNFQVYDYFTKTVTAPLCYLDFKAILKEDVKAFRETTDALCSAIYKDQFSEEDCEAEISKVIAEFTGVPGTKYSLFDIIQEAIGTTVSVFTSKISTAKEWVSKFTTQGGRDSPSRKGRKKNNSPSKPQSCSSTDDEEPKPPRKQGKSRFPKFKDSDIETPVFTDEFRPPGYKMPPNPEKYKENLKKLDDMVLTITEVQDDSDPKRSSSEGDLSEAVVSFIPPKTEKDYEREGAKPKGFRAQADAAANEAMTQVLQENADKIKRHHKIVAVKNVKETMTATSQGADVDVECEYKLEVHTNPVGEALGSRSLGPNFLKVNGVEYFGDLMDLQHPLTKKPGDPPSFIPKFRVEHLSPSGGKMKFVPVDENYQEIVSSESEYGSLENLDTIRRERLSGEPFGSEQIYDIANSLEGRVYPDSDYRKIFEEFCQERKIPEGHKARIWNNIMPGFDKDKIVASTLYVQGDEVHHLGTVSMPFFFDDSVEPCTILTTEETDVIMSVEAAPWRTSEPLKCYLTNLIMAKQQGVSSLDGFVTRITDEGVNTRIPGPFIHSALAAADVPMADPEQVGSTPKGWFQGLSVKGFILSVCSLFLIVYCLYRFIWRGGVTETPEADDAQCFVAQSKDEKAVRTGKNFKFTRPQKATFTTNSGVDSLVRIKNPDGSLWAIPLDNTHLIIPYHFSIDKNGTHWAENTMFEISYRGKTGSFPFLMANLTIFNNQDLAILEIPVNHAKDVRIQFKKAKVKSLFLTESEIQSLSGVKVQIEKNGQLFISRGIFATNLTSHSDSLRVKTQSAIMYDFPGNCGDCGLPVLVASGPYAGKIVSIHTACNIEDGRSYGPIIASEMIEMALAPEGDPLEEVPISGDFKMQGPDEGEKGDSETANVIVQLKSCPGVVSAGWAERRLRVPRNTALRPSAISSFLDWKPAKTYPLMSKFDRRIPLDVDPGYKALLNAGSFEPPNWDMDLLKGITEDLKERYATIDAPMSDRLLTFEETIAGVPGVIKCMDSKTSSGYPWILHESRFGKKGLFYFDQDILHINSRCKEHFEEIEESMLRGERQDTRYLAYVKDELMKETKVQQGKCRLIFSFSAIHNMVMRKYFGYAIARFQHGCENFPPTLGINPSSFDMDRLHRYMTELGPCDYVAGDYKNFDRSTSREVLEAAMDIICHLAPKDCPEVMKQGVKRLVLDSPVQYEGILVTYRGYHPSGCLFTTIINCLVNEIYFRYIFTKRFPLRNFDHYCRLKVHGDDHILSVKRNDEGVRLTPVVIGEELSKLNLLYTMDVKDQELTDEYREFDQITYLGCEPKLIFGLWCGVLKEEILNEMLHWTRNKNLTLLEEMKCAVILSSVRGREFYTKYRDSVQNAANIVGLPLDLTNVTWHQSMRDVGNRVTGNTDGYMPLDIFRSELEPDPPEKIVVRSFNSFQTQQGDDAQLPSVLTKFDETRAVKEQNNRVLSWKATSIQEIPFNMTTGTESFVVRESLTWTTDDTVGSTLASWSWPHKILSLGDQDNLQNMPFQKNQFFEGDCEVMVQATGGPFLQGLLVLFHVYGNDLPDTSPFAYASIMSSPHVLIDASRASTSTLRASFRYFCNVLQTDGLSEVGKFYLVCYVPLRTTDDTAKVALTMYSKFPDSDFTIPRMVPSASRGPRVITFDTLKSTGVVQSTDNYELQGFGDFISGLFSPIVTIGKGIVDIAGGVVKTVTGAGQLFSFLGFDNPPISAHMPVALTYPNLSNIIGPRHVRTLGASNQELASRRAVRAIDEEADIGWLGSRKCLFTVLTWKTSQTEGTELLTMSLDNLMGRAPGDTDVPMNVALINQFWFWRGDVKLTFLAVKSRFHVGRLNCSVAYATDSYLPGQVTTNYNQILDFTEGNDACEVLIPYNAKTSYLAGTGFDLDSSLGVLKVTVRQNLIAPSTVFPDISVLVLIQFENLKVAVPRPVPPIIIEGFSAPTSFITQQGEDVTDRTIDTGESAHIETTATGSVPQEPPTRLELGELFEYPIRNLSELTRRYIPVDFISQGVKPLDGGGEIHRGICWSNHWARALYTYWTGGFCWRVFAPSENNGKVPSIVYTPYNGFGGNQMMPNGFNNGAQNYTFDRTPQTGNVENLNFGGSGLWIDVRSPMYSVYNYLYTEQSSDEQRAKQFSACGSVFTNFKPIQAFQAGADDFRFHCYRPPVKCSFSTSDGALAEGIYAHPM
ncbi:polyprotein [Basavirus sp.]|nr:polyprotein [Basavirus sp.]